MTGNNHDEGTALWTHMYDHSSEKQSVLCWGSTDLLLSSTLPTSTSSEITMTVQGPESFMEENQRKERQNPLFLASNCLRQRLISFFSLISTIHCLQIRSLMSSSNAELLMNKSRVHSFLIFSLREA